MAKQTNDYKPTGFNIAAVNLTAADTTVSKLVLAAGANDSVVNQFTIRNAHTVSATVEIILNDGSVDFIFTTVVVPASAGNLGTTAAFDVLGLACIYNALINLKAGWSLRARAKTTLANDLTFVVIATDY